MKHSSRTQNNRQGRIMILENRKTRCILKHPKLIALKFQGQSIGRDGQTRAHLSQWVKERDQKVSASLMARISRKKKRERKGLQGEKTPDPGRVISSSLQLNINLLVCVGKLLKARERTKLCATYKKNTLNIRHIQIKNKKTVKKRWHLGTPGWLS